MVRVAPFPGGKARFGGLIALQSQDERLHGVYRDIFSKSFLHVSRLIRPEPSNTSLWVARETTEHPTYTDECSWYVKETCIWQTILQFRRNRSGLLSLSHRIQLSAPNAIGVLMLQGAAGCLLSVPIMWQVLRSVAVIGYNSVALPSCCCCQSPCSVLTFVLELCYETLPSDKCCRLFFGGRLWTFRLGTMALGRGVQGGKGGCMFSAV